MNKTQTPQENISTSNTSSFKVLLNIVSKVLTKTKEQESITNNSAIEVATNMATNIFDQTTGNIGTSKEYFSNVIDIFRRIYKEPIISTTDTSPVSKVENLKEGASTKEKEEDSNKEVENDFNYSLEELTDCINNPENCI
jgi:hypothetical protein